MECTQPIECTQPLYEMQLERTTPEQIGFLGICGSEYPVRKGPNKIGRDPQTCQIVLDLNSISRQHAVINILNNNDFMLMDLGSANKSKILDKVLQPYIPYPLKNGDTVQFGQIFGIFRLLEEDDDLPMTQVIDVPETPVNIRHVTKVNNAPITTIPESPDVSDRDDSFIVLSQSHRQAGFNSPNNNFIKPSAKTTGIQPVGTNKIDNVYWTSSKKSDSFSTQFADNCNQSVNKSTSLDPNNIHDMETQPPFGEQSKQSLTSIHDANTINSQETQAPNIGNLPQVQKIGNQDNVTLNLYSTVQSNDIYDMPTQRFSPILSSNQSTENKNPILNAPNNANKQVNTSDDEICFEEIDNEPFAEDCGSQPLLPENPIELENLINPNRNQDKEEVVVPPQKEKTKIDMVPDSDSSTDCEDIDIAPSQRVHRKSKDDDDDDVTDCEDIIDLVCENTRKSKILPHDDNASNNKSIVIDDDDVTDCEGDVIEINNSKLINTNKKSKVADDIEDLPTQIISVDLTNVDDKNKPEEDIAFEDMATQVIEECPVSVNVNTVVVKDSVPLDERETQIIDPGITTERHSKSSVAEHLSPFKVPPMTLSPVTIRKIAGSNSNETNSTNVTKETACLNDNDENYYAATQEIFEDLCTDNDSHDSAVEAVPSINKHSSDNFTSESTHKKSSNPGTKNCKSVNPLPEINSDCSSISDEIINADLFSRRNKKGTENVDQNLSKKCCANALPSRSTRRIRKPTSKMLDGDETMKKISENMLKCNTSLDSGQNISTEKHQSNSAKYESKKKTEEDDRYNKSHEVVKKKNVCKSIKDSKHIEGEEKEIKSIKGLPERNSIISGKYLKQQDIKSMLNESRELRIHVTAVSQRERNTLIQSEQKSSSRALALLRSTRRCGSKYNTDKEESSYSTVENKVKHDKKESSDRKPNTNRKTSSHKKETETSPEIEQTLRRSKRQRTSKEKKVKDEAYVKEKRSSKRSKEEYEANQKEKRSSSKEKNNSKLKEKSVLKKVQNENNGNRKEKRSSTKHRDDLDVKEKTSKETRDKKYGKVKEKGASKETKDENDTNERDTSTNRQSRGKKDVHKNAKEVKEQTKIIDKAKNDSRINKSFNSSAVYNMSSESGASSPASKRPASDDSLLPTSKRSRSIMSLRATPRDIRTQRVLFTAFPNDEVKAKLEQLGAVVVTDVFSCTVVLTLKIKRTFKFLCAVGLGKPIVGPSWVQACADTHMIVDPWLYLLKDSESEKRYNFDLRKVLSGRRNVFKGLTFSCTPNVTPNPQELKLMVECSGGEWKEGGARWRCVSCAADAAQWGAWRRRGARLVSAEFVLAGALRQELAAHAATHLGPPHADA